MPSHKRGNCARAKNTRGTARVSMSYGRAQTPLHRTGTRSTPTPCPAGREGPPPRPAAAADGPVRTRARPRTARGGSPSRLGRPASVLHLRHAFLIHMDDFDRFLNAELVRVLDPVVRTPAPPRSRHWRDGRRGRLRTLNGGANDAPGPLLPPHVIPLAVPAAVGVPSSTP